MIHSTEERTAWEETQLKSSHILHDIQFELSYNALAEKVSMAINQTIQEMLREGPRSRFGMDMGMYDFFILDKNNKNYFFHNKIGLNSENLPTPFNVWSTLSLDNSPEIQQYIYTKMSIFCNLVRKLLSQHVQKYASPIKSDHDLNFHCNGLFLTINDPVKYRIPMLVVEVFSKHCKL